MLEYARHYVSKILTVLALTFAAVCQLSGQTTTRQPNSVPNVPPSSTEIDRDLMRQRNAGNIRFDALRDAGSLNNGYRRRHSLAFDKIRDIYRKPTSEESELLVPARADLEKYAEFLRRPRTGLLKLVEDLGCSDHSMILVVSEECLKYSMPGGGSSYSFRTDNYRIWRLADLTYADKKFQSLGILLQGIIVNIGEVPLESVNLKTKGLKYLNGIPAFKDFGDAKKIDLEIMKGLEEDGFFYSRTLTAEKDSTFVLRSIAYRGSFYRSFQGITYNEMDFDKRKDITIAFRVVRKDEQSVTILWKELGEKDSPKIKIPSRNYDQKNSFEESGYKY